jgi:ribonuclease J
MVGGIFWHERASIGKDIYLLRAIALADPAAFPDPLTLPDLKLYADPKAAPRPWERVLRKEWATSTVQPAAVCATPGDYILAWSLWDLNDLLDLEGTEGGIYLYSNSRAYDDEQAADLERPRQWVKHMGLTLFGDPDDPDAVPLHAAGPELADLVRTVSPRMLIPVHTEHPDWWQAQLAGTGVHLSLPEFGSPMHVP